MRLKNSPYARRIGDHLAEIFLMDFDFLKPTSLSIRQEEALTRISHQLQKNPHTLFSDAFKNFSWKGLQTFPSRNCLAPQKTVCTPFPRAGEKYGLRSQKTVERSG